MGALRTKMIEEMRLRNFSPRTEQSYVAALVGLARFYRRSPDQLTQDEIRSYLLHLQERGLSPSSRNVAISGMKFFYHQILGWDEQKLFSYRREKGAGDCRKCSARRKSSVCFMPTTSFATAVF